MEVMEVVGGHVSYISRQLDQNVITKLAAFLLGFVVQFALRKGCNEKQKKSNLINFYDENFSNCDLPFLVIWGPNYQKIGGKIIIILIL